MARQQLSPWDVALIIAVIAAIPTGIFHLVQGRYGQTIIALIALVAGGLILATGRRGGAPWEGAASSPESPRERRIEPEQEARLLERDASGRLERWIPAAIISGFAATGVMTVAIILGYTAAITLGDDSAGASTFARWMAALADNSVAGVAESNLSLSVIAHFLAGIVWALLYAALVEPRLSGPGWRRGLLFSLLPWLLSVAVFFPATGAGFFGVDLDAGPLPVVGNLVIHLIYGFALGQIYTAAGLLTEDGEASDQYEPTVLARSERLMAVGILPGMLLGGVLGLIGSSFLSPSTNPVLVASIGAVLGAMVGVLIGSFVGLSPQRAQR